MAKVWFGYIVRVAQLNRYSVLELPVNQTSCAPPGESLIP